MRTDPEGGDRGRGIGKESTEGTDRGRGTIITPDVLSLRGHIMMTIATETATVITDLDAMTITGRTGMSGRMTEGRDQDHLRGGDQGLDLLVKDATETGDDDTNQRT